MILFLSDVYNYKKSGQAASRTKLFLKMCTSGQVLACTVHYNIISTSPSLYAILLTQVEFVLVQTFDNYLTFFCYFSSVAPVVHDELTAPTPDAQALIAVTPALKSKLSDLEKEIERFRMENTELAKLKKDREGKRDILCIDIWGIATSGLLPVYVCHFLEKGILEIFLL